ncbi:MAG: cytochrome bc complex cytochrome b subunit [Chloroflexi bacterium]|nr:cytochrome bc complex cytochrome b subunit [Chloroflexota bacterium]MCC6895779.1 cytochrome bc complex cytochrome b subunit [Anaerolineae bacterium]
MSVLPFPSFLDDVKEKGLKKAVFELVDESVERLTAGMNIQDIREALRGEPASRKPNPRLQPHADGFWLHMRPSYFHADMTGLYPEFRLGWLSTYLVFFETITGILLMVWYTPSPEVAYTDMLAILSNVPMGQLVRDLHRLGAEAMVLIVSLHMARTFFTGSYKKPRQFTWFTGLILLAITGFLSFSGYLLPWDQLALWAVTIGASMIEATPPQIVGDNLNLLLRGGPDIGANGLLRFYLLHVLALPALLFVFTGVHYYKVIVHGHSLPPKKENIGEDTAKRVPLDKRVYFIPDVLTSEIMWIAVTTLIFIVLCIWFYDAPLEHHADPQVTPLGTTAPWYFLWIQGALKLGDKVFFGIIFPTIILGVLAVWPYLDVTPSRRYADRRFAITFFLGLISFITSLSYMGLAKFGVETSPDTEILHELMYPPQHSRVGALLPIPFEQLVPGMYTTRQIEGDPAEASNIVAAFDEELAQPYTGLINSPALITGLSNAKTTIGDGLVDLLADQKLAITKFDFKEVPSDAPELLHVLTLLEEDIAEHPDYLVNGWGAIVITQNQGNLKRVDMIISWNEVQVENGKPKLDASGEPILALDTNGNPIVRYKTEHVFIHEDALYFSH